MGETAGLIRRPAITFEPGDDAGTVACLPSGARFSLRIGADETARRRTLAGLAIGLPINRCDAAGGRISARLGPDEWLIAAPEQDGIRLAESITAELAGAFFALVDISHRNAGFRVDGTHAAAIVNGGCPLDLDDAAFPSGSATRTLLGKAEIVLIRSGPRRAYRIECGRSFAPYVHGLLREVAREFDAGM
jgi:sarcosine oxidase subunit gamma